MSIREGNALFKRGEFEKALAAYASIEPSNPMYQYALYNAERVKKLIHSQARAASEPARLARPVVKALGPSITPAVKGIAAGKALVYELDGAYKNNYYRITILTEQDNNVVLSIRDSARNLPLYQSAVGDIRKFEHIFFVPPSLVGPVRISIHFVQADTSLERLGDAFLVLAEKIGDVSEPIFKPKILGKPIVATIATIESRLSIAIDAAHSLLAQVDRVHVHINDMSSVPKSLNNARIVVTTEQTHGNLGDAGKFLGARNESNAYILVADDDFIFPYDFIIQSYLKLSLHAHKVVIGMHGIFLRFPVDDYYSDDARNTMHITTGFSFECTSSAVGTGAVFFDSSAFPVTTFLCDYKNMADIWFAMECNRLELPILIQKRHTNWLIDNPPPDSASVIWRHSTTGAASAANTRIMQTYVLGASKTCITSLPLKDMSIGKDYALVLDAEIFSAAIPALEAASRSKYSPAIFVVRGATNIPHLRKISRAIYSDVLFVSDQPDLKTISKRISIKGISFFASASGLAFTAEKLGRLIDVFRQNEKNLRTEVDFAIFSDQMDGNGLIQYLPGSSGPMQWPAKVDARVLAPISEKILKIFSHFEKPQVDLLPGTAEPIRVPLVSSGSITRFADYFDHVYLLNMDRRPDRLQEFSKRAAVWGINFTRISAVDGSLAENKKAYETHQAKLKDLYGPLDHRFKYESSSYWEYSSEGERISHLINKNGKTYSAGGYGYLRTYRNIIEDALKNGYDRIAVFDDDCLFHKDLNQLFAKLVENLPDDWVTLSLGTLQYDWRDRYVNWASRHLYRCGGFSVGSHAQAYSRFAFPLLLEYIDRYSLPFDVGPLHYLKRYYSTKSFSAYPNLFIQDVGDTDIGDSAVQLSEGAKKNNVYRWDLNHYE